MPKRNLLNSRKAALDLELDTIIQLVFAGMILLMWFAFAFQFADGSVYKNSVYATDNALLAEVMHIADKGELRATTLFADDKRGVELEGNVVSLIFGPRESASIHRRFATFEDEKVIPNKFTPRIFEWVYQDKNLYINPLIFAIPCPAADTDRDLDRWSRASYVYVGGSPASTRIAASQAVHAVAIKQLGAKAPTIQEATSRYDPEIYVEKKAVKLIAITHATNARHERLTCYLKRALEEHAPVTVLSQGTDASQGVGISVPIEVADSVVREAIKQAYEEYFEVVS